MPARLPRRSSSLLTLAALIGLAALGCDDEDKPETGADGAGADGIATDQALDATDATTDVPDGIAGDATADALTDATDLGPDAFVESPVLRIRFDPDGRGFYRTPWPSDARLTAIGTPELNDFPLGGPMLLRAVAEIEARVHGYATMPVIYVAFDDAIAEAELPAPLATLDPASPIQLVELGADCGRRVPVEASIRLVGETDRFTEPDVLQVKNTVGALLKPEVPYALIVTTTFGANLGKPAAAPPAFAAALAGDGTRYGDSLQPLRDCLPALAVGPPRIGSRQPSPSPPSSPRKTPSAPCKRCATG